MVHNRCVYGRVTQTAFTRDPDQVFSTTLQQPRIRGYVIALGITVVLRSPSSGCPCARARAMPGRNDYRPAIPQCHPRPGVDASASGSRDQWAAPAQRRFSSKHLPVRVLDPASYHILIGQIKCMLQGKYNKPPIKRGKLAGWPCPGWCRPHQCDSIRLNQLGAPAGVSD